MSFRDSKILVSDSASDGQPGAFELKFPQSYVSNGKDSLALYQLSVYYSWNNITALFGNQTMAYIHNGVQYNITFPAGFYTIEDLNYFLQLQMRLNGHFLTDTTTGVNQYYLALVSNPTYYAVTLTQTVVPSSLPAGYSNPGGMALTGTTMQLVIPPGSNWGDLIGFSTGSYPPTPQTSMWQMDSNKVPQISPITTILVHCDWLGDTRFTLQGDVLDQFTPNTTFGSLITYTPPVVLYAPAKGGTYDRIRIRFTDQSNRPLVMQDNGSVLIALSLRQPL